MEGKGERVWGCEEGKEGEGRRNRGEPVEGRRGKGGEEGRDVICSLHIDCHSWLRQLSSYVAQ